MAATALLRHNHNTLECESFRVVLCVCVISTDTTIDIEFVCVLPNDGQTIIIRGSVNDCVRLPFETNWMEKFSRLWSCVVFHRCYCCCCRCVYISFVTLCPSLSDWGYQRQQNESGMRLSWHVATHRIRCWRLFVDDTMRLMWNLNNHQCYGVQVFDLSMDSEFGVHHRSTLYHRHYSMDLDSSEFQRLRLNVLHSYVLNQLPRVHWASLLEIDEGWQRHWSRSGKGMEKEVNMIRNCYSS